MMYDDTQIPINLFIDCIKCKIKILYYQQYTGRWNFILKKKKQFDENFNKTMRNKKKIVVSTSRIEN